MIHPLTVSPQDKIPAGPPLIVRGDYQYPPFEFVNEKGDPDGFNIDIFKAIARVMHLNAVINLGPWAEVRKELEEGKIDVLTGMYKTEEREKKVDFTIPQFIASYNIFVRKDSSIKTLDDIRDRKIIVQKEDLGDDFVRENGLGSEIIRKKNIADCLQALSRGEGDCAVVAVLQGALIMKERKLRNLKIVGEPVTQKEYCLAVRSGDADLLAELNEGLNVLKSSGEYDRIYDKWFGVIDRKLYPNYYYVKVLLIVLAVFFVLLFLALLWFRALRHQVAAKTVELREELRMRKETQKRLEDALREVERTKNEALSAQKSAEEASQVKTLFLANMSHELRTPLNGVIGMLDILKKTGLTANQSYFLDMAEYSADHLMEIIGDILDFSQLESGRLGILPEHFDVNELVGKTIGLQAPYAEKKGIPIVFSPLKGSSDFIGDKTRISQILINLISNAIKYSDRGTVKIEVENESDLVLRVSDEGIGIPEDKINAIFSSFTQLEDPYTKEHRGSGLGLSIVKGLLDLMGGEIGVHSVPGEGSVFTVTIPRAETALREKSSPTGPPADSPAEEKHRKSNEIRILVVEDERINLLYLKQLLEGRGYRVFEAVNGEEAVEKALTNDPDIIFMDIGLPGLNGIDAAKRIWSARKKRGIPVIALTAHSSRADIELFLKEGMTAVITKPFKEAEVFRKIEDVIG